MANGIQGLSFELSDFVTIEADGGFSGIGFELIDGFAIRVGGGFLGIGFEQILQKLNSIRIQDQLNINTEIKLDNVTISFPNSRVFELGSDLDYDIDLPIENCFFDEVIIATENIIISGTRRATFLNGIEYSEPFVLTI